MAKNLDDTRKRLDIDNLDFDKRKDLFNKFVDKGGKVEDEKEYKESDVQKTKRQEKLREKKTEVKEKVENNNIKSSYSEDNTKKGNTSFSLRFFSWLNAYSSGSISFTGKNINMKFLKFTQTSVIPTLIEVDTSIFNILNPVSNQTSDTLAKRKSILSTLKGADDLELIERVKNIYNESLYKKFTRACNDQHFMPETRHCLSSVKEMVKPFYITNLYRDRLKSILIVALDKYGEVSNVSKSITNLTQTRLFRNIDLIYDKFYPTLLSLLIFTSKADLSSDEKISEYLGVSEEDILGFYTAKRQREALVQNMKKQSEFSKEQEVEKVEETEEDKKKRKIIAVGIKLIDTLIAEYEDSEEVVSNELLQCLDTKDKIYRMNLLLDILDNEYTDLFSSNKVKYNVIYDHNAKIDYQSRFSDIIVGLTDLNIKLKEYSNVVNEIKKVDSDKRMRIEQRVPILNDKNSQRSYLAKNINNLCLNIVTPLKNNLDALLLSKEERERIIANPHDIIQPNNSILGIKKRTEGYSVLQALTETYYFVSGFHYLITEGNLSGTGLLVNEKKK